ncbi:UNVERIFIED_CONTAM: hypothetical protein RMT77_018703 [Armadillidium vulgare]
MEEDFDYKKYGNVIQLKDKGYSWVVLGAMVVSNALTAGYLKSFGIICNSVLDEFPDTSGSEAGLMMGLLVACGTIPAPFTGALGIKFGSRISIMIGAILCFVGLSLSYFCTSVWQLSLMLGGMMGMGICLIETVQIDVMVNYFEEKLAFANGFRVSGESLGSLIFPLILLLLVELFGVRGLRLILASIFLNIIICATLIYSPETHRKIQILSSMNDFPVETTKKAELYKAINSYIPNSTKKSNKKSLEFHYFKNSIYWLFILSTIAVSFSLPIVFHYIPIYGRSFGLSSTQISLLLSSQAVVDTILRIIIGFISNKNVFKKLHVFIFCLFIGSIGIFLIPVCAHLWQIYFTIFLFSIGPSGYRTLLNVVLDEQFGKTSITSTWGFIRMVLGIFSFINSPLIGAIIDASNSYVFAFIFMGGGMFFSAIFLLLEPLVIKIINSPIIIT